MDIASDHYYHLKKNSTPVLFLSLICVTFIFLAFSLFCFSTNPLSPQSENLTSVDLHHHPGVTSETNHAFGQCNYSDGSWIYDPTIVSKRYDGTCKEIFKGWNCMSSNKSNAVELVKWRWKPRHCALPIFDPVQFLERFRNTNIGFVGDSLNRNMFVSLFCTLRRASSEVKKWRPAGADRGFTFLHYNLTIAYHRTNLLARYGRWSADANGGVLESLGYREGFRVDIDVPEGTWAEAPSFHDILILNTGHWWWAPAKFDPVKSPMLFFKKGLPIIPPVPPDVGLDMVLEHMLLFVERKMQSNAIKFVRTQSPRHFEGGDWDQGGTCQRQNPLLPVEVEELFTLKKNGTNVETRQVNQHLQNALKGSSFHVLDITRMSEYRADAHPATAGGKKHDDCMHWCLPGITDTWNDLFISHLYNIKFRNSYL